MSKLTYYCTCYDDSSNRRLHTIDEIGFSLPEAFWGMLFDRVEAYQTDAGQTVSKVMGEVSSNLPREATMQYLSRADINVLFPGKNGEMARYDGDMVVTFKWLKKKARITWNRLRKLKPDLPEFPEDEFPEPDEVLYRHRFILRYHDVNGIFVPKEIRKDNDTEGYSSKIRRCPCGKALNRFTGTSKEIMVVMQGSSRAGKTTEMIAIEYLLNEIVIKSGSPILIESCLDGLDQEEKSQVWVSDQHGNFKRGIRVVKTEEKTATENLIYSFRLRINGVWYVLTVVDMAGEIFDEKKDLSDRWISDYGNVYRVCDAVWTFVPYQTLADVKINKSFLLRHQAYYKSLTDPKKKYEDELREWMQVTQNTQKTFPSYEEYLAEVHPGCDFEKLKDKYSYVHEARFLSELGETSEALTNAGKELYKKRLEEISSVWSNTEKRPVHAVILTKSDGISNLFLDREEKKLSGRYVYQKNEGRDSVLGYGRDSHGEVTTWLLLEGADHVLTDIGSEMVALDEATMNRICRNVRRFFKETSEFRLKSFESMCPGKTSAFALSAYGGRALGKNEVDKAPIPPKPYNVLVPLMWTLAAAGILPVSYVRTEIRDRTSEEVRRIGTGRVVREQRVASYDVEDPVIQHNLFKVNEPYCYHEVYLSGENDQ